MGGVDSCAFPHQEQWLRHKHHSQSSSLGLQPHPPCSAANDGLEMFYPHLEAQKYEFMEADVLAGELRIEFIPHRDSGLCHQGAEEGGSCVHGEPGTARLPSESQEFPDQAPSAQV